MAGFGMAMVCFAFLIREVCKSLFLIVFVV